MTLRNLRVAGYVSIFLIFAVSMIFDMPFWNWMTFVIEDVLVPSSGALMAGSAVLAVVVYLCHRRIGADRGFASVFLARTTEAGMGAALFFCVVWLRNGFPGLSTMLIWVWKL